MPALPGGAGGPALVRHESDSLQRETQGGEGYTGPCAPCPQHVPVKARDIIVMSMKRYWVSPRLLNICGGGKEWGGG